MLAKLVRELVGAVASEGRCGRKRQVQKRSGTMGWRITLKPSAFPLYCLSEDLRVIFLKILII